LAAVHGRQIELIEPGSSEELLQELGNNAAMVAPATWSASVSGSFGAVPETRDLPLVPHIYDRRNNNRPLKLAEMAWVARILLSRLEAADRTF
jgi:hypothetical protein